MSTINKTHFKALTTDRKDSLRLLNKSSMRGIRDSIVEKYSEQAHFVYELLQNADDVKADYVKFLLRPEGLYFIHNGKIPFTVTLPNAEKVGHINAITSIGQSSKKEDDYKIGKFGIGFKSVFQYTKTPEIYDPNVAFRIRDLIVPELLDEKMHPLKIEEETLFYFPFNQDGKSHKEASQEIENRLLELEYPLLFLNNIRKINWDTPLGSGDFSYEDCIDFQHKIICKKTINKAQKKQEFLKLTKTEEETKLPYSLVFLLNAEGKISSQNKFAAHCFFPTRVQTPLRFILHAPFLLTDSREGIKTGNDWNKKLIQKSANFLCESLEILKEMNLLDEDFFSVLPLVEKEFLGETGRFLLPFYQNLKRYFLQQDKAIFPTENQHFIALKDAFLPESLSLVQLIENEDLKQISQKENAAWIFSNTSAQSTIGQYFRQIIAHVAQTENRLSPILNWERSIKLFTADFLEKKTDEWLILFYEEMLQHHRSLWSGERAILQKIPIIRLGNGKMTRLFEAKTGKPLAYFPVRLGTDYPTVKEVFLEEETSRLFLENLGVTKPELREELEKHILPKYIKNNKKTEPLNEEELAKIITHYFSLNAEEAERFSKQLSDLPILKSVANSTGNIEVAKPNEIYFSSKELLNYFEGNETVKWLQIEGVYDKLLEEFSKEKLYAFFLKIEVANLPRFVKVDDSLSEKEKYELMQEQTPGANYPMWEEIEDFTIEGLSFFLEKMNVKKSLVLWGVLAKIFEEKEVQIKGFYRYQYQANHEVEMEVFWFKSLKEKAWLVDTTGNLFAPKEKSILSLSIDYQFVENKKLLDLLFADSPKNRLELLTEEERKAMKLGQQLLQNGIKVEDFKHFKNWQKKRTEKKEKRLPKPNRKPKESEDEDEFNPAFMSSEELLAKQEELRHKLEVELEEQIAELMKIEQLKATINEAEKYSFLWFKSLLDLEYILAFENTDKDKSLKLYFQEAVREDGTEKTVLLRKPNGYLPQRIEDMGDITLKLQLKEERRTLAVEVVSIKDFDLRAKLKSPEELKDINFKEVINAVLEVQNTIFTLEELVNSFKELDYENEDNLRDLLPKNVRFIFGPPGTGKTTHLVREEIIPTMLGERDMRMLVLTPTNKSADVLVTKLLEINPDIPEWLVRFGVSTDNMVENAGLLQDNTMKLDAYDRVCVVTTATRFPYDGFDFRQPERLLKTVDWDVILIDEASMISLAMATFILLQKPMTEIIIAGDPFQIEPIVYAEEWKGMNIYSMVQLNSFDPEIQKTQLVPHQYTILNLETQYRAISTLGYIFSHFAYEGKLRHHRMPNTKRPLIIKNLEVKDVNIIRFPVNKLETLYRPQKLNSSHYHIYSALLTTELVKYLVEQIQENHILPNSEEKTWRIGIICPYKAQAMLVDKIIASQHIFKPKIKVSCGTIHSFQGDECDIMVNLFNPPARISRSPNMFLNRQNILNVGVSRARDYLFLLMPDEQTENFENLYQINSLLRIIRYYLAGVCSTWHSYDLEKNIFGQIDYIEKNTFATTHQSINVYTEPEKRFEIRAEETAVDVQISKKA